MIHIVNGSAHAAVLRVNYKQFGIPQEPRYLFADFTRDGWQFWGGTRPAHDSDDVEAYFAPRPIAFHIFLSAFTRPIKTNWLLAA